MKERISKLLSVKSLVTLIVTVVFAYLCMNDKISASEMLTVYSTIIAFYFGTQVDKKSGDNQ